ncbi:MAG: hypothetical protein PHI81_09280 [Synergistaceae bacterium]|nr:hypothetical protein [Synergistaceae bacterium]
MKKLFVVTVLAALAVLSSAAAFAGTYAMEKAGIQFTLPDSWQPADSRLGTMFVSPKGDMVAFFGEVDGEEGLDGAFAVVDEIVAEAMTDVEYEDAKETEINGIPAVTIDGAGKSDGEDAFVSVGVLNGKGDFLGLMVFFGEADAPENNEADVQALLGSLQAVK